MTGLVGTSSQFGFKVKFKRKIGHDLNQSSEAIFFIPWFENFELMDLEIKPETKIDELKASFQKRFPQLKIEILSGNSRKILNSDQLDVADLSGRKVEGSLHITGLTTVVELERLFKNRYGLNAQVFRKSGKVWLQTTTTDEWTLDEQNHEALESQKDIVVAKEESDIHEQE